MFHRLCLSFGITLSIFFNTNAEIIKNIGISLGGGQSFEIGYERNTYSKMSFSSSISLEFIESNFFSIKSLIGYDQKGSNDIYFKFTNIDNNGVIVTHDSQVNAQRKSHYFSMRIFAKPKIPLKTFSPFLLVGPRIDCLSKRQVEDIWLGAKPYDITDKATKWIFGISAGLGTDINFKNLTVAPFVLADFDINESKVEFGNVYRNFQYRIFIDASYNIGKGK